VITRVLDPSWAFCASTVLSFPERGRRVDLRLPLSEAAAAELRGLGLGERFGVVTPFNPRGPELTRDANMGRLSKRHG